MRSIVRLSLPLLALFAIFFSTGCDDGTTPGSGVTLPPLLRLNSGAGIIDVDQELDLSEESFIVNLTATTGDANLNNLRIEQDGLLVPASRLNFRTGQTANNPILLFGSDAAGFTYEIEILRDPAQVTGPSTYSFTVNDENNLAASEFLVISYVQSAPTVELVIEDGFVSSDATVLSRGGVFNVRVRSTSTGTDLQSLTVLEDGNVMDASQLSINGGNVDAMNPLTFATGEMSGATYRYQISPENTTTDTRTYTFQTTDVDGGVGEVSINITFDTPPGTALTLDTMGVFFNATGQLNGGLDLDNGIAVAFDSPDAEIQDEGIDDRIAPGTENWRAQISSVNGTTVRAADLSMFGDGITFGEVDLKETIQAIFEDPSVSTALAGTDFVTVLGDPDGTEEVSLPIQGGGDNGEVFAVRKGDTYYLVQFTSVNYVAGSNADSYDVSIRY
ncbi:hypothetical protein [Lewinella sp. 4G2]|uniref:hypothetical protein n=1 Tax=Lewinella sp. 4G2 TaxID=1803372 RepID=UPI0007B4E38C|nr:hypothetical protein [Lewinella sp. 4G2]OAV44283.1 hypothetical protein A3850_007145 [Lewinella sp. 4G2]